MSNDNQSQPEKRLEEAPERRLPSGDYKTKRRLTDAERFKWRRAFNDYRFQNCDHEHDGYPNHLACIECVFECFEFLSTPLLQQPSSERCEVSVTGKHRVDAYCKDCGQQFRVTGAGEKAQRPLPTAADLLGSDPEFTGSESTDEYIRRIRGRSTPTTAAAAPPLHNTRCATYEGLACSCGAAVQKEAAEPMRESPAWLLPQIKRRLQTVLDCDGGMCTHCIDVLSADVFAMLERAIELSKHIPDAGEVERLNQRIAELERRLRIPFGKFPCALCGGPHDFDTSVPSVIWNGVIRARGLPDYLCTTCIVREFVRAGQGFTAELWNEEFNGVPIEVVMNGQNAKDASAVQDENNSLRNQLADALQSLLDKPDAAQKGNA